MDLLNTPACKKIHRQMENSINKVQRNAGKRYLKVFRRLVRKHNTRNHKVTIQGGMGLYYVAINGKMLMDYGGYHNPAIFQTLWAIEKALLSDWDWSLEGESLNP